MTCTLLLECRGHTDYSKPRFDRPYLFLGTVGKRSADGKHSTVTFSSVIGKRFPSGDLTKTFTDPKELVRILLDRNYFTDVAIGPHPKRYFRVLSCNRGDGNGWVKTTLATPVRLDPTSLILLSPVCIYLINSVLTAFFPSCSNT